MTEVTSYRIGEVAARVGVSTRTIRYYEELGLLSPSAHSPGGARRYDDDGVARVERIRELQHLVGFNLDEIRAILTAEDRLGELRSEFRAGRSPEREQEILEEAIEINNRLRTEMRAKLMRLETFLADLDARAGLYRRRGGQLRRAQR